MKTSFQEIVDVKAIGDGKSKHTHELLNLAGREKVTCNEASKNVLLVIDMQNDFMEQGSLGVPGAHGDVERLSTFVYENTANIHQITLSLDTHHVRQIFHPYWWVDKEGGHPNPYTIITYEDVKNEIWTPVERVKESIEYVKSLEEKGNKQLCIWTYHCLEGTMGAALEGQFANMVYFHSYVTGNDPMFIPKGLNPISEMYGIVHAEYEPELQINTELLETFRNYDRILVAGEAKSHCVLESLRQIATYFKDEKDMTKKIHVLSDCMSSIPGFEEETEKAFFDLQNQYGLVLTTTKELKL